jgi:hypothetical protein
MVSLRGADTLNRSGQFVQAKYKIDLADFPNVLRWYRAMMAREGVGQEFGVTLSQVNARALVDQRLRKRACFTLR